MGKTYTINANDVLHMLNEARQRGAAVSITGKVGDEEINSTDAKFATDLISARHSRTDRTKIIGYHTFLDDGVREYHQVMLLSEMPPYELEIKYSLKSEDADHYGGIFGFLGLLKDVGKAILQTRD